MTDESWFSAEELAWLERDWEIHAKYIRHQRIDRHCPYGAVSGWFIDAFDLFEKNRKGQIMGKELCDWAMNRLGEKHEDGWN